jgi:hypothetical protein
MTSPDWRRTRDSNMIGSCTGNFSSGSARGAEHWEGAVAKEMRASLGVRRRR